MKEKTVVSEAYSKYLHNILRFGCIPFSVEERKGILNKIKDDFSKEDGVNSNRCTLIKNIIKILPQMPMQIKTILIVTVLETYLKDKFLEILLHKSDTMKKFHDRQIRLGELLEEKDKDVNRLAAEHIADSFNFQKIEDIESVFEEYFKINILEEEKQNLQILFQIRHILIHNSGIIDKDFLCKVKKIDQKEGEMIKLDEKEIIRWILSVCKFINKLEDQLDSKFELYHCLVEPESIMPFLTIELKY